jgi:hypothetical protein
LLYSTVGNKWGSAWSVPLSDQITCLFNVWGLPEDQCSYTLATRETPVALAEKLYLDQLINITRSYYFS